MRASVIAKTIIVLLLLSCSVAAQTADEDAKSHWGVVTTFAPSWQALKPLEKLVGETFDISGSEFKIGIARGREQSGDWGVEYIRKGLKDGSTVTPSTGGCSGQCVSTGRFYVTRGVALSGIEAHKFIPFGTIKRRVQIGLNLAGGVAQIKGQVETHRLGQVFSFDPRTGAITGVTNTETVTVDSAHDLFTVNPFPVGKVELAVAMIAAPGLKIRASGGLNFPGTQKFSLAAVYFFGR